MLGFFHSLGLPLRQLYSANEAAGAIAAQQDAAAPIDSVGAALPGVTVKIAPDGEIWVAGPNICVGYDKADQASAGALHTDEQGVRWFRTGDSGRYESGQLWFHDRQADLIAQNGGPALAPQSIEGALKWSPFITQALVFTDQDQARIGALIVIDANRTGRWAVERGMSFAGAAELASLPEVGALIQAEICRINPTLPEAARVRRFALMPGAWTADAGELTRSYKLRRRAIHAHNTAVIAALWSAQPALIHPESGLALQFGRCDE